MPKVEFHFDFGSPNAYLAHLVIPEIEQRTGTKFEYVPVLLGGVYKLSGNRSPAESLAGVKNKPDYERLETARFIKRHGITRFRQNPFFPVNTLTIMRGAIAAQRLGVFERYVDEIYRHMWSGPKKLDDPAVLRTALLEFGFAADRFAERVQDSDVKARLLDNTERSVARGTFGSPTFFVGDEIFFGKDRLRDVEEMILATHEAQTSKSPPLMLKRFEQPDEVRTFEKGKFEIVRIGGMTIGRATYEPGWKWSSHVGPTTGASSCSVEACRHRDIWVRNSCDGRRHHHRIARGRCLPHCTRTRQLGGWRGALRLPAFPRRRPLCRPFLKGDRSNEGSGTRAPRAHNP